MCTQKSRSAFVTRNTSALLQEFERRFARLSALDRSVLYTSRVLLFVKSVNSLDRKSVDPLLETDDRLTADWAMIKRVCGRFDKLREWGDEGPLTSRPIVARKPEEPFAAQREETRSWLESGSTPTGVAKGSFGGAALEELTQMVRDLPIAQAQRDNDDQSCDRRPPNGHRCMWCDVIGHIRKDSVDFAEALMANIVYLWNEWVQASETRRDL